MNHNSERWNKIMKTNRSQSCGILQGPMQSETTLNTKLILIHEVNSKGIIPPTLYFCALFTFQIIRAHFNVKYILYFAYSILCIYKT